MPVSALNKETTNYNITANNGDGGFSIRFEMDKVPREHLTDILNELAKGFRDIEVINSYTGEVAITLYTSCELFEELCPPEMCIDMVRHICKKRNLMQHFPNASLLRVLFLSFLFLAQWRIIFMQQLDVKRLNHFQKGIDKLIII